MGSPRHRIQNTSLYKGQYDRPHVNVTNVVDGLDEIT